MVGKIVEIYSLYSLGSFYVSLEFLSRNLSHLKIKSYLCHTPIDKAMAVYTPYLGEFSLSHLSLKPQESITPVLVAFKISHAIFVGQ